MDILSDSNKKHVEGLLNKTEKQISKANNKEKVEQLTKTYEAVLDIDVHNYKALWSLGSYYLLLGMSYSNNLDDKETYYIKTAKICERAMETNSEFRTLSVKGEKVWKSCRVLTINEMEALYYWFAAIFNYWDECLSGIAKIMNFNWPKRFKKILTKMMEIDPHWYGGRPFLGWAQFYSNMPNYFGGDPDKSDEYLNKALESGGNCLYKRIFNAKYNQKQIKNIETYKKDLKWIISQNPHNSKSTYPWSIYYQKIAKELLADINK